MKKFFRIVMSEVRGRTRYFTQASQVEKFNLHFNFLSFDFCFLAERAAPAKLRALFFFEKKMKLRTPGCVVQADLQMRKNYFSNNSFRILHP